MAGEDFKPQQKVEHHEAPAHHEANEAAQRLLTDASAKHAEKTEHQTPKAGKEEAESVKAVQAHCESAGHHAKTLERNGQDHEKHMNDTITAEKGSVERACQIAAVKIAKGELPADPKNWTPDHHKELAKLASA